MRAQAEVDFINLCRDARVILASSWHSNSTWCFPAPGTSSQIRVTLDKWQVRESIGASSTSTVLRSTNWRRKSAKERKARQTKCPHKTNSIGKFWFLNNANNELVLCLTSREAASVTSTQVTFTHSHHTASLEFFLNENDLQSKFSQRYADFVVAIAYDLAEEVQKACATSLACHTLLLTACNILQNALN